MAGKILVTGATGNIGGEIVRLLKEKNADIVQIEAERYALDYQGCRVIFRQKGNTK